MKQTYIAIIHKDPESDFGLSFPDFPGCVTAGDSFEEAASEAEEVLKFHIAGMSADGEEIPEASNFDFDLADEPGFVGVTLIEVDVPGRKERYNVTLDVGLVARIDEAAGKGKRSDFLGQAAEEKLGRG